MYMLNEQTLNQCLDNNLSDLTVSVQRQIQSPMPIVISSMLTTMATAMQSVVTVKTPNGLVLPTNLYMCVIADSGERKTSTQNLFLSGLKSFVQTQSELNLQLKKQYEREMRIWNLKHTDLTRKLKKAITKQNDEVIDQIAMELELHEENEPKDNQTARLFYEDVTLESLLSQLSKSILGGLYISSEAGSIFKNMTTKQVSALNMLWDNETIQVDRQTQDSFELDNVLSCSFALQPELFTESSVSKESMLRGSGLIARMLICAPQSTQGYRITTLQSENYWLKEFNERIEELCQWSLIAKQTKQSICLEFDEEATILWLTAASQIEQKIAPMGEFQSIKDIASKFMNNATRIAAILHFYHRGKPAGQVQSKITAAELTSALQLIYYYTHQSLMLFGEKTIAQQQYDYANILFWYLKRNYTPNQIYFDKSSITSNGPRAIRKSDKVQMAIDKMLQDGFIVQVLGTKKARYALTQNWFHEAGIAAPYNCNWATNITI